MKMKREHNDTPPTQMVELAEADYKVASTPALKDVKENMLVMN